MKHLKSIARTAVIIFVSLVVGFNLYNWNAKSLMGNALPMPFGYGAAVVLTGSMEPTIMADDLIIVADQESYNTDDIVVYQSGDILVVHRIVEISDDTVITKGDANQATDDPIAPSVIKGKVIATFPKLGNLVRILKTPAASIALLAGAVVLMESSYRRDAKQSSDELEKIKEEIRKLKQEQE